MSFSSSINRLWNFDCSPFCLVLELAALEDVALEDVALDDDDLDVVLVVPAIK